MRRSFPVINQIFDLASRIFTVCIFDLDIELAQENTSCTAFEEEFTKNILQIIIERIVNNILIINFFAN
ncbi:MAG: hypothetical protein E6344_07145 [Clostridium sp.]|nr:hypothetical protein [Clostridium sp.]MDU7083452.1 hypothetical protein [Clostridium sp.]